MIRFREASNGRLGKYSFDSSFIRLAVFHQLTIANEDDFRFFSFFLFWMMTGCVCVKVQKGVLPLSRSSSRDFVAQRLELKKNELT